MENELNAEPAIHPPGADGAVFAACTATATLLNADATSQSSDAAICNPPACAVHADRQPNSPQSPEILIVEDSLVEAEILRRILVLAGYRVVLATNGEEGLHALREYSCALVLSDINMPLMNGYELCHTIKFDEKLWATPVILVTMMSEPKDIITALDVGADGYITKPYVEAILLGRIRSLLAHPSRIKLAEERRKVQVEYGGENYNVTVGNPQMANLLLSVYENSLALNQELMHIQNQLNVLNEDLDEKVRERTAALRISEEKFRKITESAQDAIIMMGDDGRISFWNAAAERIFGYTATEALGQELHALIAPAPEQAAFSQAFPHFLATGEGAFIGKATELTASRKGGETFPAELSISATRLHERWHAIGIVRDITEHKRAEQKIHQLNAELERRVYQRTAQLQAANADLENFCYSVSHDLRAPLRAIDGFASILRKDYATMLDKDGLRLFQVVSDNAKKMGQLIDDILGFSRAGRSELRTTKLDMNALVQQVWQELEHRRMGRAIEFHMADLPAACGDSAAVHQVWQNLLDNALKFTRGREPAVIEVSGRREEDEIVYSIRDNGAGFDMEYADKLFGLFQRLHRVEEFEGTGVGLAIVKRFIMKQGGRVWAKGKVGESATFCFTLPA